MTLEQLNTALYEKVYAEQQEFISSLKTMTPENIIQYAYELVIREDILLLLEENDLDARQCKVLLKEKKPLDKLFLAWEKHEGDHMNEIRDCIENKANDLIKLARAREMDLLTYLQTYEPDELVRISGNTYTTKTHDSLKISNGMWMWWSRGIGGRSAVADTEVSFNEYDDVIVRRLIECIRVLKENRIIVVLKGGFQAEENLI